MIDKIPPSLTIKALQTNQSEVPATRPLVIDLRRELLLAYAGKQMNTQNQVDLSAIGQLISTIIDDQGDELTILGSQPLLSKEETRLERTPLAEQLKTRLQQALSTSGVFYESHQRQWLLGEKGLSEIANEAQAHHLSTTDVQQSTELKRLVNQQLTVLENQELRWTGELTPSIPLQWHVAKDQKQHAANTTPDSSDQENWSSELRIDFPHLGCVAIALKLRGEQIGRAHV